MALDISYLSAFGAGALSFLPPAFCPLCHLICVYMAGVSFDRFAEPSRAVVGERRALIWASVAFVLGFSTVFILLGREQPESDSSCGSGRMLLAKVAGIVIILMGLNFLASSRLQFCLARGTVHA